MPAVLFRIVAIALLVLAIPLQGVASVVAGQCMMFGHHQDGAAQESHGHGEDGADGHDHAAQAHDSHCGPCAACCASASIAGPLALSILSVSSTTKYLFSPLAPPGIQPHGVDRPPLAL